MNCIYCNKKLTMLDMVNEDTVECPSCGTHQNNAISNTVGVVIAWNPISKSHKKLQVILPITNKEKK